jgi:hypothetical protein
VDCTSALDSLSQRLDGPLQPPEAADLDAHLAACDSCRRAAAQFSRLDVLCRRELAQPEAARLIAENVLSRLSTSAPPATRSSSGWSAVLLAVGTLAAALLAAVTLFPRVPRDGDVAVRIPTPDEGTTQPTRALFNITLARGTVEARPSENEPWNPVSLPTDSAQPAGSDLRTLENALCEFTCPSGSTIRVDSGSEIRLASADALSVRRGRLWCRAAEGAPLRIVATHGGFSPSLAASMTCAPDAILQTSITEPDAITVLAAENTVEVLAADTDFRLPSGRILRVTSEECEVRPAYDVVTETAWMMPLLALRGSRDSEFSSGVDAMLARLGKTKISYFHEEQLRDLGAPAALPLVAFLRQPAPGLDPEKRLAAARVIRETAPEEAIPDLVELLADESPDIRVAAAGALQRLTGLTHGVAPDEWRFRTERHDRALDEWRAWLKTRDRAAV